MTDSEGRTAESSRHQPTAAGVGLPSVDGWHLPACGQVSACTGCWWVEAAAGGLQRVVRWPVAAPDTPTSPRGEPGASPENHAR